MREVVAGAGAHEGRAGHIRDGIGMLRRGRACQRGPGASKMPLASWSKSAVHQKCGLHHYEVN